MDQIQDRSKKHPESAFTEWHPVSPSFTQKDWIALQELLRGAAISSKWTLDAFCELTKHILKGPDPEALNGFLEAYGRRFILPEVSEFVLAEICRSNLPVGCIVDVGCGTGWLGTALGGILGVNHYLADKRPMHEGIHKLDIETDEGLECLVDITPPTSLMVFCETLHCLDNPAKVLKKLSERNLLVIERLRTLSNPWTTEHLARLNVDLLPYVELRDLLAETHNILIRKEAAPHMFFLLTPRRTGRVDG